MKAKAKESTLIGGIEFSVGAKIVIKGETEAIMPINAEVTRVTTKSVFIRKDGETEDKMVVNRLVETYLEKKLWDVTPVPAEEKAPETAKEPKAPKVAKEKAPKVEKVPTLRKLSKNATIHYLTDCGLTKKEIKVLLPECADSHIGSAMYEVKDNHEWRKRSVDLYLAWNAIDPILYPLALVDESLRLHKEVKAEAGTPTPEPIAAGTQETAEVETPQPEATTAEEGETF